jgi:hypothetical protein
MAVTAKRLLVLKRMLFFLSALLAQAGQVADLWCAASLDISECSAAPDVIFSNLSS